MDAGSGVVDCWAESADGLVETEGVGENPEKMNPFQSNPTRFASKLIPSQPICPVNPLTLIQIIPHNNTTQKLQILSDPLAGLRSFEFLASGFRGKKAEAVSRRRWGSKKEAAGMSTA